MVRKFARKQASLRVVTAAAAVAVVGLAGCATTGKTTADSGLATYQESAVDVVNRAPTSMSLPDQTKAGFVLDNAALSAKADFHFTLAESLSLEGESAKAIEEYKLTLVYDPNSAQVRLRLAAEYVKSGLVSEAVEQCKAALEIDTKHVDARLLLGGLYSAMRMYDDAIAQYRVVVGNDAENFEAPLFIGAILAEQKKYKEAVEQFETLANNKDNPTPHIAYYYIGRIKLEESAKNTAVAEAAFKSSLKSKPSYTEALIALGNLYEGTSRKMQTIALYRDFQEKNGPSAQVAEELSRLYVEQKDYSKAYEQFAIMESNDRTDVNVKAKMAFILIEQRRYPEAIERLEAILSLEPSSDKIRFYLGAVFEETKDYKSAQTHFEKVPVGSSYFKEAVIHVAYLQKMDGDYNKAIATIENGIQKDPDQPQFYALYASLLDDTKQYKRGVEMLNSATAKFPEHAQLQFFLGSLQDRVGNKDGSIDSMKKVISIDKDHIQALNFLAYAYADQGKNLDEAEQLVRRAASLQPNDGFIMDTLGWVLFKRGKTAEAIRTLEAAYKMQPEESVIAEHLGDAYYHSQMPEKAKKLYVRAAELDRNVANADKIRAKVVAIDRQVQTLGTDSAVGERKPASN
ncbi:MAG: tetratricopeptide repeat protein [Proteobacteria bacterium]|nr:MAG: tetratricopeptide repeat protein [Pseudomonadota bacterium]